MDGDGEDHLPSPLAIENGHRIIEIVDLSIKHDVP
jgi:hypothetical protein